MTGAVLTRALVPLGADAADGVLAGVAGCYDVVLVELELMATYHRRLWQNGGGG